MKRLSAISCNPDPCDFYICYLFFSFSQLNHALSKDFIVPTKSELFVKATMVTGVVEEIICKVSLKGGVRD